MATIDNLQIQLNANAEAAIAAINRTASSAERLRGAAQVAAGGMQSAAQGAQDMGSSTAQAGEQTEKTRKSLHGFWNALKQSGSYLGGAFLGGMKGIVGALGSIASGLLRIAKFRIYRTIIKDLGQSFKDLYGWSKMFGSEYANSMDRINSSFVYLRISIASAAAPLVEALLAVAPSVVSAELAEQVALRRMAPRILEVAAEAIAEACPLTMLRVTLSTSVIATSRAARAWKASP